MNKDIIDVLKIYFKEVMKFAIFASISLFFIALVMAYIVIYVLKIETKIDIEVTGVVVGIITAVFIFVVDNKKLHSYDKILESNRKILKILFKNKI